MWYNKKIIYFIALILCGIISCIITTSLIRFSHPIQVDDISFEPGTINLGDMPQYSIKKCKLKIKNTSHSSIKIVNVLAGCNCTVIEMPSASLIEPGNVAEIGIEFSSQEYDGLVSKLITVVYVKKISGGKSLTDSRHIALNANVLAHSH